MFLENEFRAAVIRRGRTLADVAAQLGINPTTLSRKLKADGAFSRVEIARLIEFLDIKNPDEIFFAKDAEGRSE